MNKDARQTFIMEQLHQNKHIKIKTLSQQLNVSMETIRRDLTELEVHYRLDRMHGGAKIKQTNIEEENFMQRRISYRKEKKELAKKAMPLITENAFIALDVSTTNLAIAKELVFHFKQLTILTNCFTIAQELVLNSDFNVLVPPGLLTKELFISGVSAVDFISNYYTDLFFMSVSGISIHDGLMDYGFQEYEAKKAMLSNAHQIYAVADHHKFGQHSKIKICPFNQISGIITDAGVQQEYIDYFRMKDIPFFY
jgi:DeoR family glycerol-3-phosphate regulon repressor